jgi:single-strand DNA-binding protein
MPDLNLCQFMGRLTRNPELRHTPNGTAVCEVSLAVNREWTDGAGNRNKDVMFIECTAWAKRAEVMAQYLDKGSPVYVAGYLVLDEWEDRDTGKKRSRHKLTIDDFKFLESKRDKESRQGGGNGGGGGGQRDSGRQSAPPPDDHDQGDGPGEPADDTFALEEDVPF